MAPAGVLKLVPAIPGACGATCGRGGLSRAFPRLSLGFVGSKNDPETIKTKVSSQMTMWTHFPEVFSIRLHLDLLNFDH